jgi:hypothetical protein
MTYATPIILSSFNIYCQRNFHNQYFIQFHTWREKGISAAASNDLLLLYQVGMGTSVISQM